MKGQALKLSLNTDFTKLPRASAMLRRGELPADAPAPVGLIVLPHDERHLRRKVLQLEAGDRVLVDLVEPIALDAGDRLVLDDGRHVEIGATCEDLYAVTPRDGVHLAELAWHIGNRHLAAAIEPARILILRDHVIKAMLEGLGAGVADVVEPFTPLRGAYSGHAHQHGHDQHGHGHHDHDHHDHGHHGHDHDHEDARDRYGRRPGDPHYGHDHD